MTKQVIVMRADLNMRRGKEIAQGAHASMAFITRRIKPMDFGALLNGIWYKVLLSLIEVKWLDESFTKICVRVNSEDELRVTHQTALDAGIESHLIVDKGVTEFHGIPTPTCCAIGPDDTTKIDVITGHLRLY